MSTSFLLLAALVCFAYLVGTTAGFGAGIIALSLGVHFLPLDYLLPVIIPLNMAISLYLFARHRQFIDGRALARRILPVTLAGLAAGIGVYYLMDTQQLKVAYGCFIVLLALAELARLANRPSAAAAKGAHPGWLLLGGFIQGLWVSGGPVIVYWASQALPDRRSFRATLAGMWLVLNTGLAFSHALGGTITTVTLVHSLQLVPAMGLGLAGGEWMHERIPERGFRLLVNLLLLAAGLGVIARG